MRLPQIDAEAVARLIPGVTDVELIDQGGQKLVFKARLGEQLYALKFLLLIAGNTNEDGEIETVRARADREVSIMQTCTSPYMVKLGPIGMEIATIEKQDIVYFSEELISGDSLKVVLSKQSLDVASTIDLGLQIGNAIDALWEIEKVHRDIKPGNIMRRDDGSFVLLDAGLAFDLGGDSLSVGMVVGTFIYCSPEQFDYSNRRALDFRSDMFSLGVTMYEACTGQHPFYRSGLTESRIFSGILTHQPPQPNSINPNIPPELGDIIIKMMGKSPHLRFRKMEQLVKALEALKG